MLDERYRHASEIEIEAGLQHPLRFLQITDMHITRSNEFDSERVIKQQAKRRNVFRREEPTTEEIFEYWLDCGKAADCILLSGDIIDAPSEGNLKYLEEKLKGKKYFFITGNHDWVFPFTGRSDEYKEKYFTRLSNAVNQNLDFNEKKIGELTLIGINNSDPISDEVYNKVITTLDKGEKTVLMVHKPFYLESMLKHCLEFWDEPQFATFPPELCDRYDQNPDAENNYRLEKKLKEYNNLVAIIAGHVHFDHRDKFSDYCDQITTQTAAFLPVDNLDWIYPDGGCAKWITIK